MRAQLRPGVCRTLTSSGKCHEYHSRTRMTNVLTSLSSVSSSAIAYGMAPIDTSMPCKKRA